MIYMALPFLVVKKYITQNYYYKRVDFKHGMGGLNTKTFLWKMLSFGSQGRTTETELIMVPFSFIFTFC